MRIKDFFPVKKKVSLRDVSKTRFEAPRRRLLPSGKVRLLDK